MSLTISIRLPLRPFELAIDLDTDARAVAIFGPSGAGKSSLIECLAGLRRTACGLIRVDGDTWLDTPSRRFVPPHRRGVGFVPQHGLLFPHLSVEQNLRYAPAEATSEVDRVVEELGLGALLDRMPGSLSGGERQRVALGRALCARPRVLLLDEPLASLDYDARVELLEHLRSLRRSRDVPIVFVSHEPEQVVQLCDLVVHVQHGKVTRTESPEHFFKRSGDRWCWPA